MHRFFKYIFIIYLIYLPGYSLAEPQKVLTIYTTDNFSTHWGAGPVIKNIFEQRYNCKLKIVSFDHASSIISRLQFEGKSTKADIVLGLDLTQTSIPGIKYLFDKHEINLDLFNLPITWKDKLFLPYSYGYLTFIYNSNKKFPLPKNFDELMDPNNEFKIIIPDPRSSSLGFDFLIWTNEVFKDHFKKKWRTLKKKITIFTKGWSEAWSLFIQGEADLVLSYDTSVGYHKVKGKEELFQSLILEEGHMIQFQVSAKLKFSNEPELADNFLNFLIEPEIQKLIAQHNHMHPVVKVEDPFLEMKEDLHKSNKIIFYLDEGNDINRKALTRKWINSVI